MWWEKKRTYLDWAAASPVSERARGVFLAALSAYGNPGSPHEEGRKAKALLTDARTKLARMAEVKTDGVIFTSGATEANALALLGSVRACGVSGARILYQPGAHASLVEAVKTLEAEGATVLPLTLANLEEQLSEGVTLIAMDAVNSETGELFDTRAVRCAIDAAKSDALLLVDASQLPRARAFTLASLGADMVTLDAQKVGGVRGIGALLIRQGIPLTPLMRGGGQEGGRRPGTESPALAAAFICALAECDEGREKFVTRAARMRAALSERLRTIENGFPNEGEENVPHILNASLIGRDTDYLVALLDKQGFSVSTKSACESDSETGSRAVLAMTGDAERAKSTLRISWGPETTETDLMRFADALIHAVRFLDEKAIY